MPHASPNLVARGNILPARFVKLDTATDNGAVQATANSEIIGVAQEGTNYPPLDGLVTTAYAATDGQTFRLYGDGDICLVEAGDTITAGNNLKSDSVGRAVPVETTGTVPQVFGAVALESCVVSEKLRVQLRVQGRSQPALA